MSWMQAPIRLQTLKFSTTPKVNVGERNHAQDATSEGEGEASTEKFGARQAHEAGHQASTLESDDDCAKNIAQWLRKRLTT
jgi:hypothetical protein